MTNSTPSDPIPQPNASEHSPSESAALILKVAAAVFLTGFTGTVYSTYERTKKELSKNESSLGTRIRPMSYKQASLFSFKAFLLGTTLCLSGSGILVLGISSALGVSSFHEFNQKMRRMISYHTPSLQERLATADTQDDIKGFVDFANEWEKMKKEAADQRRQREEERERKRREGKWWWED
ncbi:1523_t:CDS:2 [Paraglomus occultum]|uniref:1523_t:CDS:1 n=1 Tax=Paraglomus occultum TaxID=144539 RepID=A0A9N9FJL4_9GLOM|nr:1523_t:CDS:2 [Paraglomus occultum]